MKNRRFQLANRSFVRGMSKLYSVFWRPVKTLLIFLSFLFEATKYVKPQFVFESQLNRVLSFPWTIKDCYLAWTCKILANEGYTANLLQVRVILQDLKRLRLSRKILQDWGYTARILQDFSKILQDNFRQNFSQTISLSTRKTRWRSNLT